MSVEEMALRECGGKGGGGGGARGFDGVVCFGGADWWYHNRGHYDLQMMREMSRRVPVLYVNSIGVRVPSPGEGGMFWVRMGRKLASLGKGFKRVSERFGVVSPVVVPGKMGMKVSKRLLGPQVRAAAEQMGIERPLVWIECPPAVEALGSLRAAGVVYQRTDRWERFPGADGEVIAGYDRRLKGEADLTVYCSTLLFERERGECRRAAYVDHGVDFERFAAAGRSGAEPEDLKGAGRPRAGFVGSMDLHTFDPELVRDVAGRLPGVTFVLVGPSTLPAGWCGRENVRELGPRGLGEVAGYMAASDVLIMPWNRSEWIEACNPVKLKEYLAVGRPIVSRPFAELKRYGGLVRVAEGAEEFAEEIRRALAEPVDREMLRRRVAGETWGAKCGEMLGYLEEMGVRALREGRVGGGT